ncbi:MAG: D-alanine--D-alanine ligase [Clostridia bacterium]|nr:D-alanine--D-alanine ligase [Clostridia bacterium]
MKKTTVLCMFGGKSTEYEVSLSSAHSILSNIDRNKYDVIMLGITRDGKWFHYNGDIDSIKDDTWHQKDVLPAMLIPDAGSKKLLINCGDPSGYAESADIDVVFPVMHGAHCEDGTLQGLLEICELPYVGPGCLSSAVAMDKVFTKLVLNNFDIPQAKFKFFTASQISSDPDTCISKAEAEFTYPIFVKPANAGSSIGTGKAANREALKTALINAAKYDSKIIIEEYITAKEIEVAVMGNDDIVISQCGEINPGSDYYDYDTKYKTNTSSAYIPANIPADTAKKVRELAGTIYKALDCKGMSRVDFFVCDDGRIVFNEINTLPGFTNISMYPKLFVSEGLTYSEIIDKLISLATASR